MIPDFNSSGALPPYLIGSDPTAREDVSPYTVNFNEFCNRFAFSPERIEILEGLIRYCSNLQSIGITQGTFWIDGSFTEDVEKIRNRPPSDIDFVCFINPNECGMDRIQWRQIFSKNQDTLQPGRSKLLFKCDAYIIDLSAPPMAIVNNTSYFFGLFSHQKITNLWKGMLKMELSDILNSVDHGIVLGDNNA